jgi:hypothetical protein
LVATVLEDALFEHARSDDWGAPHVCDGSKAEVLCLEVIGLPSLSMPMHRILWKFILLVLICRAGFGQDRGLAAYWSFDDNKGMATAESSGHAEDIIEGNFSLVNGVRGSALKFDGFTTRIKRNSSLPTIDEAVTFETWIAPQAYPWNWNAIVEQKNRYFFGLDATGHIGIRVFVDDQWRECVSAAQIPFMQWSHIAGTFDPNGGLTLYINGEEAGHLKIAAHLARGEVDPKTGQPTGGTFQIGRNLEELPAAASIKIPASYSFDGIIDELKIYDRALDAGEIKTSYESLRPTAPPALTRRKLPLVPDGQRRFGAFYTSLKFYPEWDQLWRIDDYPDLVVTFDNAAYKMVFWHGTTYNMNLVTENGRWIGDQSAEAPRSEFGCVEHMSDKQARYSHVRLIESSPARVVVHWRYALTDVLYNIGERDPITGWGDWADEYYTSGGASMRLNDKPVAEGKDFRVGHIDRLEGSSLVVWVRAQLTSPSRFSLIQTSESH